ncbi:MAG: hypothetical protein V5A46_09160 [Haloferacaceae archaeon]
MATETSSRFSDHARGVTVTTVASLAGIAAALGSAYLFGTTPDAAQNTYAVIVMAGFVLVQFPLLKLVGIDVSDFGVKDNLYVTFMTFTLWFITYTVLLTSEVAL